MIRPPEPLRHPCFRCGCETGADFCMDCRRTDPEMTAGGRTAKQRHRDWSIANQQYRDALREISAVLGCGGERDRAWLRARREAQKAEA